MRNLCLLSLLILFLVSCSTSKIVQCPTGEYKEQKFKKTYLTLKQRKNQQMSPSSGKIAFTDLQPKKEYFETKEYASVKNEVVTAKPQVLNYKPVVVNTPTELMPVAPEKTVSAIKIGSEKKDEKKIRPKDKLNVKKTLERKASNPRGMAIASLVLGILSLFIGGIILGTLATVFGALSMNKLEKGDGRGMAVAGLILGILGIVGGLVYIALYA
jgi:hypothetical protein